MRWASRFHPTQTILFPWMYDSDLEDIRRKLLFASIVNFWGIKAQKDLVSGQKAVTGRLWQGKDPNPECPRALTTSLFFLRVRSSPFFQCNWVQEVLTVAAAVFEHSLLEINLNQPLRNKTILFWCTEDNTSSKGIDVMPTWDEVGCSHAFLRPFLVLWGFHCRVALRREAEG